MRIEKRDGSIERRVLTGMITDRTTLAKIAAKWEPPGLFRAGYANLVAQWAIDYHRKYDKAPLQNIEGLFEQWAERHPDKKQIAIIEKFLGHLSDEYENLKADSNSGYIVDLAGKHFNAVRLSKLSEGIQDDLERGKSENALERAGTFDRIELGVGAGIDALHDENAIREAFEDESDVLIQYPGALGKFFDDSLERDGFVAFMGPEKRGKTFWLLDVAYRALFQRRRVGFFQCGDLSQKQMMRRILIRAAGWPRYPSKVRRPFELEPIEGAAPNVHFKTRRFKTGLTWQRAWKACGENVRKRIRSKKSYLKLSTHPNTTLSVPGIESILDTWARDDWIADVIVIDYADILLMEKGDDRRDKINEAWKALRGLSQKYHCLVVTATQSDAASYNADTLGRGHFSEDKRKLAHVTGMIGINQNSEEKEEQLMRLNWIARREAEYIESRCVYAAGCLALGNPAVLSCF